MNYRKMRLFTATACLVVLAAGAARAGSQTLDQEVIARVRDLSESKHVRLLSFGKSEQERMIPAFVVTDFTQPAREKHRILIMTGQHGDEPSPVRSVLSFFEELVKGEHPATLSGCVLIVVPLANPDGAQGSTRANSNCIDLNRDWSALTTAETRFVHGIIRVWKPEVLIDGHEWVGPLPTHPNAVEAASLAAGPRAEAMANLSHRVAFAAGLRSVVSGTASDGRLFHRRYSSLGYATLLLETGPGMSGESKQRSYRAAFLSVSSALLSDESLGQVMSPASASFEVADVAAYLEPLPEPHSGPSTGLLIAVVLCAYSVLVWVIRSSSRTRELVWSRKYRRCLVDADVPLNPLVSRRTLQPITSRSWTNRRLRARYAESRH